MHEMSQNSFTTTTSFIVSSDESLNKPPLSSSQSTASSDNMTATSSESGIQTNQYFPSPPPQPPAPNPAASIMSGLQQQQQHSMQSTNSTHQLPQHDRQQMYQIRHQNDNGVQYLNNYSGPNHPRGVPMNTSLYNNSNNNNQNNVSNKQSIYGVFQGNTSHQIDNPLQVVTNPDAQRVPFTISNGQTMNLSNELLTNGVHLPTMHPLNHHNHHLDNNNSSSGIINSTTANNGSSIQNNSNLRTVQSFQNQNQNQNRRINSQQLQHSPIGSVDSNSSNTLMPINVKGMLLHGVVDGEVLRSWLISIKCEEYIKNFLDNGYDMPLLTRMTPQDLTAIGVKSPTLRKKLQLEIKKLNLDDDIPDSRPHSLEKWLELLKLSEYQSRLCNEGYDNIDKVLELTWEDLEEIGITKLGHQKRLLLGIERVKRFDKSQEERFNDNSIYDVHPNHRMSLNQNTLGRPALRSGFFQTRSAVVGNIHKGVPVATVTPALKNVNSAMARLEISGPNQVIDTKQTYANNGENIYNTQRNSIYQTSPNNNINNQTLRLSDSNSTVRRNPPPQPPMRTNSLKDPNSMIYGDLYTITTESNNIQPSFSQVGSTSFLRTPKLGTLTATTNKMLTSGGHIQSINGQATLRSMFPIREAPPPPIPGGNSDTNSLAMKQFSSVGSQLMNSSIEHQLASADEFPPPPPCQ